MVSSSINPAYPVYGSPTTESVRDNFGAARTEINYILDHLYTAEADIAQIQTNVGVIQGQIATLQHDVGTLQTDVGHLQGEISRIDGDIHDLQQDVQRLEPAGSDGWIQWKDGDHFGASNNLTFINNVLESPYIQTQNISWAGFLTLSGNSINLSGQTRFTEPSTGTLFAIVDNSGRTQIYQRFQVWTPDEQTMVLDVQAGSVSVNGDVSVSGSAVIGTNLSVTWNVSSYAVTTDYLTVSSNVIGNLLVNGNLVAPNVKAYNSTPGTAPAFTLENDARIWATSVGNSDSAAPGWFRILDVTSGQYRFVIDLDGDITITGKINGHDLDDFESRISALEGA
jgi:hypothetical protein